MRGRVACESEILFLLANDFVHDSRGDAIAAKSTGCQVVIVTDETGHRIVDRHHFVDHALRLAAKVLTGRVAVRRCEEWADRLLSCWV